MDKQESMIPVIYEGVRLGLLVRHKDGIIPLVEYDRELPCPSSLFLLAAYAKAPVTGP